MDADGYSHYEDYPLGINEWELCLTDFERKALENYLWENRIADFILEVYIDQVKKTFSAVAAD